MARALPQLDDDDDMPKRRPGSVDPRKAVKELSGSTKKGDAERRAELLKDPVPQRATKYVAPGDFCYLIQISQAGEGLGAVTVLTHEKKFTQEEIDEMVKRCARITDFLSVRKRRQQMVKNKVGVDAELNERCFASDVEFFEGVMMDRHQFKRLSAITSSGKVQPTARNYPRKAA